MANPIGLLDDGTVFYAPVGALRYSEARQKVQCHLCGRWYRALTPNHIKLAHGWDHLDYKRVFGLNRGTALQAPSLGDQRSASMRRLLDRDARVQKELLRVQELQRSGGLDAVARPHIRGPQPEEHRRRSVAAAALGAESRRASARALRDRRVNALGYANIRDFLIHRYVLEARPLAEIAIELRCSQSTISRLAKENAISRKLAQ
jgi:hypothetical protein